MIFRLILPEHAVERYPDRRKIVEGTFTDEELLAYNEKLYNIYYLPNGLSKYTPGRPVDGSMVDQFEYVFVDFDLKSKTYLSKEAFTEALAALPPSRIVDTGNGIHAYWRVSDLDALSYLKLCRRLMRRFNTDPAVGQIFQLLRYPGTVNTKDPFDPKPCLELESNDKVYTCEELSKSLPPLTQEDAEHCKQHFDKTYNLYTSEARISDRVPAKFDALRASSKEVRDIWLGNVEDRSKADYRLAHIMRAEGFTRDEAIAVLANCQKAIGRSAKHRLSYAENIVDKVGKFCDGVQDESQLSTSVRDILKKGNAINGERFPCWEVFDGTHHGFRLTQVLGLVGGSGSGKTTLALNYFYHFTKRNPEYIHLFVSLEQPEEEIAVRWARMAGDNEYLHDRVHVMANYNPDGSYRNLALHEIKDYIKQLEERTRCKVGCVVIDHIGVLRKESKDGEAQGLIDICHTMKAFAKDTNTFLVMQSQTSREKAGIGDLELDKDAAFGTSMFEWYCDYVVTTWQPIKRIYDEAPHMTCSAFKYCKIRNKRTGKDKSKEDVVHVLMFDPETERLRLMTQKDEIAYAVYSRQATTLRNKDRKREPTKVTKIDFAEGSTGE